MKYPLYCLRDNKVGFGQPQVYSSEQVAIRDFAFKINQPDSLFDFAPADFDLFEVGSFDSDSGQLESIVPRFVCNGMSVFGDSYGEIRR